MWLRLLFLLLALVAIPDPCAAQVYQPGFRTLGIWQGDPQMRVDVNIWYPTTRQPKELNYPPWTINGAQGARPAEGRFPLLIISHASPADRFSHHNLAEYLAREGFIIAAPTHGHDSMNNMDDLFTWNQLARRASEINSTIDLVLGQKDLVASLDRERIGLIGFGSGATTALLLGGALPDCAPWPGYCRAAGKNDVYCSDWAEQRMASLCLNFPLKKSMADVRIKAIAAIAPGFGMIFGADSFAHFKPPLLLVSAGRDKFNRTGLHCLQIAKILGARALFLDLPAADESSMIAPCPQALAEELPELCNSVPPAEKDAIQARLKDALLAFFSHYLIVTGNLPVIVAPPHLEEPQQESQAPAGRRKQKR